MFFVIFLILLDFQSLDQKPFLLPLLWVHFLVFLILGYTNLPFL